MGLVPLLWWVELSLFPLTDRAISEGVFWGICDLSTILGILTADGQSCGPPVSLFGMRCLAQKPAGSWMKLCLGVRMGTQVREGYGGFVAKVFLFSQAWS